MNNVINEDSIEFGIAWRRVRLKMPINEDGNG